MFDFSLDFYRNKKVLITGHSGFKGAWLCRILVSAGAEVIGYSLGAPTNPSLFNLAEIEKDIKSITGDIRDLVSLKKAFDEAQPEIVIHMAAQPIVRTGYENPLYTYETNVMGTANILECVRLSDCTRSFLNVTTDKVYLNRELNEAFTEDEPLDGHDPYSNSKSCSELVTHSYKASYFEDKGTAISTARAGNVIGGGDFAKDRIIPDCVRAAVMGKPIFIRNPQSTRPYQHVLEPLFAYLMLAASQYEDSSMAGYYNIGPDDCDCITTGELATLFCKCWGEGLKWESKTEDKAPREANFLRLNCDKLKQTYNWKPAWHIDKAIERVVDWTRVWNNKENVIAEMDKEIKEYLNDQGIGLHS